LPEGTCDTHIHVFGPPGRYPLSAKRDYTPVAASLADYVSVMDAYGIARAVLVQPSVYGIDNTLVLETLALDPDRLRAVVVIPPDLADAELRDLDRAGVRGVRINRRNQGGLPLSAIDALARRIAGFGWHIQLHDDVGETTELVTWAERLAVPLVIDHFGLASPAAPDNPATLHLLRLVERGCYVKLSAPYRILPANSAPTTFRSLVERLAAIRPDRLLWGTDWPHVAYWQAMPDDGELAALTEDWLPAPALRRQVLVANPARLYWGDDA
jgi:predicted TIM-barrel fold metal-dependent hydrolase